MRHSERGSAISDCLVVTSQVRHSERGSAISDCLVVTSKVRHSERGSAISDCLVVTSKVRHSERGSAISDCLVVTSKVRHSERGSAISDCLGASSINRLRCVFHHHYVRLSECSFCCLQRCPGSCVAVVNARMSKMSESSTTAIAASLSSPATSFSLNAHSRNYHSTLIRSHSYQRYQLTDIYSHITKGTP